MNYSKNLSKFVIVALIVFCSLGLAAQANATTLAIGDSRYLGSIVPGTPSSPSDEVDYINHLIDLAAPSVDVSIPGYIYTRTGSSCGACTDAVLAGFFDSVSNPSNTGIASGYTYLVAKYGPNDYVWYIGGIADTITIPANLGTQGGLSHFALFNPSSTTTVPEPNSLMLLGLGLASVGTIARRRLRK